MSPKSQASVLIRDRKGHTVIQKPYKDESRDGSYAATSQEIPGAAKN